MAVERVVEEGKRRLCQFTKWKWDNLTHSLDIVAVVAANSDYVEKELYMHEPFVCMEVVLEHWVEAVPEECWCW
jgi:hypothetical protein